MLDQKFTDLAKKKLFEDRYGKFDWVEKIVSNVDLLNLKPRMIIQQIAEALKIEVDAIRSQTFYSWLRRYKTFQKNNFEELEFKGRRHEQIDNNTSLSSDKSWKTFKPTVPVNDMLLEHEPILKTVEYSQ